MEFRDEDEVTDFGNYEIVGVWVAENSVLKCNSAEGDESRITRKVDNVVVKRIAMAVKREFLSVDPLGHSRGCTDLRINGLSRHFCQNTKADSTTQWQFWNGTSDIHGEWIDVDFDKWYVAVLDYDETKVYIYEPDGTLLDTMTPWWSSDSGTWYWIQFISHVWTKVYVDWVAILEET